MNWADVASLTARLNAPPRLYLHRGEQIDEPTGSRGRRFWVISRALCRFHKLAALPDASAARQLEALQLQIERLSPFAETGSHCHAAPAQTAAAAAAAAAAPGEAICLWLWDAGLVREAAVATGVDLRRMTVVPETAMHPPDSDGVRLVECLDGVEGQCWENGVLSASRWWPATPDPRNWVMLQRGGSIPPERMLTEPPPAAALPWLDRPWTRQLSPGLGGIANFDLRTIGAAAAVVLLVGYGYYGAEWLRLGFDTAAVERGIARASIAVAPMTEARAAALASEAMIERLHALDRYPSQLAVMAQVADILPKNETHLTEWSYDRGQLEFTVAAAHPLDATFFVRALDRVLRFKAVSAERAGGGSDNSLRIRLTIEPQ
jgi:hypothetical protein